MLAYIVKIPYLSIRGNGHTIRAKTRFSEIKQHYTIVRTIINNSPTEDCRGIDRVVEAMGETMDAIDV